MGKLVCVQPWRAVFSTILLLLTLPAPAAEAPSHPTSSTIVLTAWELQSSSKVGARGETISTPGFLAKGWYPVKVPTTVVAALVQHKVLPDPSFGMNLRSLPGVSYPIGSNFSNLPMRPDSPFAVSWWYRTEFSLPTSAKGKIIWLNFGGINYRANVWLNGKRIATAEQMAGAWRTWEFNVSAAAKTGGTNVLAVQIWAPHENDLAITFVDWNPAPPDKNMGLWRSAWISVTGPAAVRAPAVFSRVHNDGSADLTVAAQLRNGTDQPVQGTLKGSFENVEFSQEVALNPGETWDVTFTPEHFPQLKLVHPRLWWPKQMGTPNLYNLRLTLEVDGKVSDECNSRFGIREVISEQQPGNHRVFKVNGKNILIRGGGWSQDLMLRENRQRLEDEFRYVQDMGLNTIRLEGKLENEDFLRLADERGVLIMAGWCCCDHWEQWPKWKPADFKIAEESLRSQMYRLRGHPSLVMWLNGSDNLPPPDVEQTYLRVEKELLWPNPVLSSATAQVSSITGEPGGKMTGPYEYVAPSYWLVDKKDPEHPERCNPGGCGGAYGFNMETSMGPAVPPVESLRTMLGPDHLWPMDGWWDFHAGGNEFNNIKVFSTALEKRYGKASTVDDFAFKSQLMTYEGVRAMFEAYSRNKYGSTGVIQWMLNNAWPSIIWHLYDFYLRPAGGYFGAKMAMEPLHPVYGYDDHSVWLVSSQYQDAKGLKLSARLLNLDMTEKFAKEVAIDAPADSTQKLFALPEPDGLSSTYFLLLELKDAGGRRVGSNLYWLSTKPETLNWEKSNWWMTPTAQFADFTALSKLPRIRLKVTSRSERVDDQMTTRVVVENPGKTIAFFNRLKLTKGLDGEEVLPVIWQDNYISLMPGEKREITATYCARDLGAAKPAVMVEGWNTE